jgi:hypothetical protein
MSGHRHILACFEVRLTIYAKPGLLLGQGLFKVTGTFLLSFCPSLDCRHTEPFHLGWALPYPGSWCSVHGGESGWMNAMAFWE